MYGATNYHDPWTSTLPLRPYGYYQGHETFGSTIVVIRSRSDHTYGNEPIVRMIDDFKRETETLIERRRRVSREQKRLAASRLRRFGLPALPEAMFSKPTFVKRACGGRWRVLTP
jgi:hypothetical protein